MLCPPPNTALECVCQASLSLPDAGPFVATGRQQNSTLLGVTPLRTCVGTRNEDKVQNDFIGKLCKKRFVD
jgi:hypothetical protein